VNEYLAGFETWLLNEDKGDKTVRTYISAMKEFLKWYGDTEGNPFEPQNVKPVLLQDYRSYMQTVKNRKPATINKALATLKTFFSWATDAGHVDANPALKVKMKRVQQTHAPKWLNDAEMNRLLYAVEGQKNDFKRARDVAIVRSMLDAGLRVEEVSKLRIQDADFKGETVNVVNGKGGKYHSVPMTKELRKVLKTWMACRVDSNKPAHQASDYVFVSERSGQMTTRGISYVVDGHLENCGLLDRTQDGNKTEGFSCHSLRHTFCKRLVNAGWSIQNVAKVAGHDSIQTTQRYVEPSQDELRTAMQMI
jgi:site-specific recombinase XerD